MTTGNFKKTLSGLIIFSLVVSIIGVLISCDSDLVYEENERIPGNKWSRYHIPVFEVEITDTLRAHDLMINIRNTGEYPRNNLFLFISANAPGGASARDTIELLLAEPSGRWKGRGFGSIWQNRFYYKKNIRFAETGKFIFEVEQAMRIEELPGIVDVGLRVERAQH